VSCFTCRRAEGEIAFVLKLDLKGSGVNREQVLDATDCLVPCVETVDSRFRDWRSPSRTRSPTTPPAACSCSAPRALDLATVQMELRKSGELAASGLGSTVQRHLAEAVAWLANTLGRLGIPFEAGEVGLSGSLGPLWPAVGGDGFDLQLSGIGRASITFVA
jgi:2-oxopent-4-enoate/cis-2-oxohex-4-enoate hydratase